MLFFLNSKQISLLLFLLIITLHLSLAQNIQPNLQNTPPLTLHPYTKIASSMLNEASGLVKSRLWPNVFWTHNDSGDEARIFPINRDGELLKPGWMKNYVGIQIPDAVNVDWEAITTDDSGNLIIADFGNNSNTRRDLALYLVKEPYPWETVTTRVYRRIIFYYPEQKEFPAAEKNYDAEAIFWWDGFVYFLTKHRSDSSTRLYRINPSDEQVEVAAELMEQFDIRGRVTAADINTTGKKLVILTETSIWLFKKTSVSEKFFKGTIYWLPIDIPQAEAVSFDGSTILILNEYGELFKITGTDFYEVNE
jgi:hypothetical protein